MYIYISLYRLVVLFTRQARFGLWTKPDKTKQKVIPFPFLFLSLFFKHSDVACLLLLFWGILYIQFCPFMYCFIFYSIYRSIDPPIHLIACLPFLFTFIPSFRFGCKVKPARTHPRIHALVQRPNQGLAWLWAGLKTRPRNGKGSSPLLSFPSPGCLCLLRSNRIRQGNLD